MGRYLFRFSYIGTHYRGVQKHIFGQNILDTDTIQGAVEAALSTLKPNTLYKPIVYISSRTDAGVHALYSSGHTDLINKYGLSYRGEDVLQQMNRYFTKAGHTIRFLEWYPVLDEFHARYLASSRTYLYRIAVPKKDNEHRFPILETNRSVHFRPEGFDPDKIKSALKLFLGKKDFRTFAREDLSGKRKDYVRELSYLRFEKGEPLMPEDPLSKNYDFWHISCSAKSFLHNQVRRIVGSLLAVGLGKLTEKDIHVMLTVPSHRNWDQRAVTAPPYGLYLKSVNYDEETLEKYIIKPSSNDS